MDREKERQIVIEGRNQGKSDEFIKAAVLRYRERAAQNTPQNAQNAPESGENILQVQSPTANIPVIKQLSSAGVGVGSAIGKAGLGIGQAALKGVGALANVMSKGTSERFTDPLVRNIERIKQDVYDKPFEAQLASPSGKAGTGLGTAALYLAPSSAVTKAQGAVTKAVSSIPAAGNLAKAARGTLGVVGRAVPEAVSAGAVGYGITGGDVERAKTDALLGGGASLAFGTVGALARGARDTGAIKSVLSKTTGIPKTAFDTIDEKGLREFATPEQALEKGRKAVFDLRARNTKMWQDSLPKIADEYAGVRTSLKAGQIKNLAKVMDEFGIDEAYLPQNLNNISALEAMNLMKGLNELDSLAVESSPKGAVVRNLRKELKADIIKAFGGEKSAIAQLWKDYSVKQSILENMDAIVSAYKTKPTQTVTAKNRLMAIFDENKPEFLKAVKDIEAETGADIIGDVASTKFQTMLPKGILKADGGLPTKAGIVDKLIKALFIPVTSPRIAGKLATMGRGEIGPIEARLFGKPNQLINSKTPATSQVKTTTMQNSTNIPANIVNASDNIPPSIQSSAQKSSKPNTQGGFISTGYKPADLSTKILKKLEGKTTVSKQFISDLTNSGDVKQVEKNLIREVLERFDDKVSVEDFGKAVEAELLPLKANTSGSAFLKNKTSQDYAMNPKYEGISLPDELRGKVKDYRERVYNSPIKTSAGETHFRHTGKYADNYFGHTRIEDMADDKTRRVIEVQSDLFQKGNLEREMTSGMAPSGDKEIISILPKQYADEFKALLKSKKDGTAKVGTNQRLAELNDMATEINGKNTKGKLLQYNNPTAHFRMVREEVKKAAQDGKTKLQFPTGETAMKIEGLGTDNTWGVVAPNAEGRYAKLTPENLKVGAEVNNGSDWIITDVLGDGKFKAVPKERLSYLPKQYLEPEKGVTKAGIQKYDYEKMTTKEKEMAQKIADRFSEEFDISGKVDTSNPIYKFYDKELSRYLKGKYDAKPVTDNKGVTWIEITVKPEYATESVEAFGKVGLSPLLVGGVGSAGVALGLKEMADRKKANLPKPR